MDFSSAQRAHVVHALADLATGVSLLRGLVGDGLANRGIRALYVYMCSPLQNGDVESFNSCFKDKCLNEK